MDEKVPVSGPDRSGLLTAGGRPELESVTGSMPKVSGSKYSLSTDFLVCVNRTSCDDLFTSCLLFLRSVNQTSQYDVTKITLDTGFLYVLTAAYTLLPICA